jgi:uncharacterized repeat protein (TIGR03806 family)
MNSALFPNLILTAFSALVYCQCTTSLSAQTVFLDFNSPGQYTNNFNAWNDATGTDGGNYSFMESANGGVVGSGVVSVFQSNDTTASYKSGSWDFSTNGATIILSTLIKANGQTSANKVQFGIKNSNSNGLNNNAGVAFESFRFVPSATTWSLREQYRTTNNMIETTLGDVNYVSGRWYKFVVSLTNTSAGAVGNYSADCAIYDYGTDGVTPGTNIVTFTALRTNLGQEIATNQNVWPSVRAYQNGGIDAWDNFLVYTPRSKPIITLPLTNTLTPVGQSATLITLADGPGNITYSWYTNSILVPGASGRSYTTPPLNNAYTNVTVIAANSNGSTTNSASITVFVYTTATITNVPASNIQINSATLAGKVLTTGGDTPTITLYYGPANGGSNPAAWSNSVPLGLQTGPFSQPVTGLAPATTYYFTSKASNFVGTVWGSPSLSFTTLAPTIPIVSNAPATSITATGATLNGQVLSVGIDTPTITFYYGPTDGGTNAGAWANSVGLGPQTASFAQAVSGLLPSTIYYFAAKGVNSAGTNWATTSRSFLTLSTNTPSSNSVAVLMHHNDVARTGVNTNETILTPGNVSTNTFGLVISRPVDDWVYAQPLIMTNVNIPGKGPHNIVIVSTVNDSIYAFDADDPTVATPYWQTKFLGPNIVPPKNSDMTGACGGNYQDFHGNMGIVGTPIIDPTTSTLYALVRTKENGVNFIQRLRALDVATGTERLYSPVIVNASVPGTGDGNVGGVVSFNPQKEDHRSAITMLNGILYLGWSSHCDWGPYHGWLLGYAASNLQQVAVFNTAPNGGLVGIWQSGSAPAIDSSGYIYFETGNGTFNAANGSFGDSFVKVAATNGLTTVDYFTPYNQNDLNNRDADVGSAGCIVLPDSAGSVAHPHLLAGGSKDGALYLLDRDNLGHFNAAGDTQIVQSITNATGQCYDVPAFFNNTLYTSGTGTQLRAYKMSNGMFNPITPVSQSPTTFGFNAPTPSISASGTSNAIVWALQVDGWATGQPAILRAYNATNLALEIYNSSMAGPRDTAAGAVKFTVPVVANGKVYVGGQYALSVYGLAAGWVTAPVIAPNGGTFSTSVNVTITDPTSGSTIYYTLDGTTPTTTSTLYTGQFTVTNSVGVRAKAFKSGFVASPVSVATFLNNSAIGTGPGLAGFYYSNSFPTNPYSGPATLVRTDAVVNFNWGTGSPDPSISVDHFTVKWTGSVQPQFSEPYTFYTTTDDGVRLWVNGQLLIDHWVDQGMTEWSGSISLLAQQRYNIEMDYYENGGSAMAMLSWSSLSTAKAVIPQTQLYPVPNQPPVVTLTSPTNGATFPAAASVTMNASASDPDGGVAKVDFYGNNVLIGTVTNTPYALTATGLGAGGYSLRTVATDGAGYSGTSAPVNITVVSGSGLPYGLTTRAAAPAFFDMPTTINGSLPQRLSLTGVFGDVSTLTPVSALIPYSVNVPLWSDGAVKTRWFAVPNSGAPYTSDEQISFAPTGEWTFPAGTVFVKHFELITDETNPSIKRRLETRLLVRDNSGAVYGVTYKWRSDNSDADLLPGSLSEDIIITNSSGIRTQTWYYPSPADCLVCHTPAANYVLGVKTRQLNGSITYSTTSVSDNQLRTLNRVGLFYPAIDERNITNYSKLSALTNLTASFEERARSYLDANCAQCHRPGGTGPTFDARYDTPLTNQNIINAPVQKGDLGYDNARIVVPHDVWRSILYDRMNTTEADIKMPELARNLIDTNAVQVIGDWINSLPGVPALAPPTIIPEGGSFTGSITVTLQHPDTNATIRYTLNNSLPTTNSPIYSGPLVFTNDTTLLAKAFEPGFSDSVAAAGLFTVRQPIYFSSASYLAGQFDMQLSGLAGKSYVLEATTNLTTWVSLSTNVAPANIFNLLDSAASNYPYRFYRVIELP